MSIDMYLESARSQATSLSSISTQCVQQNMELIKVLENFVAEEELKRACLRLSKGAYYKYGYSFNSRNCLIPRISGGGVSKICQSIYL